MEKYIRKGSFLRNYSNKQHFSNQQLLLETILKNNPNDKLLLDLGCGDGKIIRLVKENTNSDVRIIAFDIIKHTDLHHEGFENIVGNCEYTLPFKDNSIDIIISNQVLEHLFHTDIFFKEIHRTLKKNGVAIISTANLSSIQNIIFIIFGLQPVGYHTSEYFLKKWDFSKFAAHVKLFNVQSLREIPKFHKFNILKIYGSGMYPFPIVFSNIFSKVLTRWCSFITVILTKDGEYESLDDS